MSFHAVCYGRKAICFNLIWSKHDQRFHWFCFKESAEDVIYDTCNTDPWRFIGIMKLKDDDYLALKDQID